MCSGVSIDVANAQLNRMSCPPWSPTSSVPHATGGVPATELMGTPTRRCYPKRRVLQTRASVVVVLAAERLLRARAGAGPLRDGPAGRPPVSDAFGVRAPVPADRRAVATDR